jgi:transposase
MRSTVTDEQKARAANMLRMGASYRKVAKAVGVSLATVQRVAKRMGDTDDQIRVLNLPAQHCAAVRAPDSEPWSLSQLDEILQYVTMQLERGTATMAHIMQESVSEQNQIRAYSEVRQTWETVLRERRRERGEAVDDDEARPALPDLFDDEEDDAANAEPRIA